MFECYMSKKISDSVLIMKASYMHVNGHEGEQPMPARYLAPQNDLKKLIGYERPLTNFTALSPSTIANSTIGISFNQ